MDVAMGVVIDSMDFGGRLPFDVSVFSDRPPNIAAPIPTNATTPTITNTTAALRFFGGVPVGRVIATAETPSAPVCAGPVFGVDRGAVGDRGGFGGSGADSGGAPGEFSGGVGMGKSAVPECDTSGGRAGGIAGRARD